MARMLTLAAGALTIAAASALYVMKLETRRIEGEVHGLERAIEKAETDIAVLKAERAYLGRPDRIDTLARRQGLGPVRESQYRRSQALLADDNGPSAIAISPDAESDAAALAAARAILAPGGDVPARMVP